MSIALKCASCGHEEQSDQFAGDQPPVCPACGKSLAPAEQKPAFRVSAADVVKSPEAPADRKPGAFRVSAADVVKPGDGPLPRLQTYEELEIADVFRKAVEEELSKDEKLVWLGRPSRNPDVHPDPTKIMTFIGIGVLVVAVLLATVLKAPIFFAVVFGLFGVLFIVAPRLLKGKGIGAYQACYAVTNRRALLFERGELGIDEGNALSLKSAFGTRCKSYLPHQLLGLERRSNAKVPGAGDLVFEYIFVVGRNVTKFPGTTGTLQQTNTPQRVPRGFFYLDNVDEVERVVRATLLANLEKKLDQ
jgi:hypothetical protein